MIYRYSKMPTTYQAFSDNSSLSIEIRQSLSEISDLKISVEQVLQAQGSNPGILLLRKPEFLSMTEEAIQLTNRMADPQLFFITLPIHKKDHISIHIGESVRLQGVTVERAIRPADAVIAAIFTIGPAVEDYVSAIFKENPAFAMTLDTAASCLVDLLGANLCQAVEQSLQSTNQKTGIPVSPGTADWDVATGQSQLFSLFADFSLPVIHNSAGMMTPKKSMSMLIPYGKDLNQTGKPCDFCSMSATCTFKKIP